MRRGQKNIDVYNDSVTLSLNEYNRLRDFEIEINGGKALRCYDTHYELPYFITKDEAVKELMCDNEVLQERISELDHTIWKLKNPQPEEPTLKEVKKMSIRAFIKWRKK